VGNSERSGEVIHISTSLDDVAAVLFPRLGEPEILVFLRLLPIFCERILIPPSICRHGLIGRKRPIGPLSEGYSDTRCFEKMQYKAIMRPVFPGAVA